PAAAAYSEASAPNWTVLDVIAKYASHVRRGLVPELRAMATRFSAGTVVGAAKCGLNPPTARTNPGPSSKPARNAADPVIVHLWARRESTSTASTAAVPASKSMTPLDP